MKKPVRAFAKHAQVVRNWVHRSLRGRGVEGWLVFRCVSVRGGHRIPGGIQSLGHRAIAISGPKLNVRCTG